MKALSNTPSKIGAFSDAFVERKSPWLLPEGVGGAHDKVDNTHDQGNAEGHLEKAHQPAKQDKYRNGRHDFAPQRER